MITSFSFPPAEPTDKEKTIGREYHELVERLPSFVRRSTAPEDLKVLKKETQSNVSANIQKLDLIMAELTRIKKAMIEAEGRKEMIAA